jgi:hypothetical protein
MVTPTLCAATVRLVEFDCDGQMHLSGAGARRLSIAHSPSEWRCQRRTSVRALFSTADGYMSELGLAGGWDRPPSCLAHLSTTRGPHLWTDPDLSNSAVFHGWSSVLHVA